MRKVLTIFCLITSLILTSETKAEDTIKIGVLTDLSGAASYYGHQTRVGATLAEQELKAQGKNVQLIFEDSALNTQRGLSAAQKLLFIDKVDALYVDFTVISVAVSSIAQVNKKLMVYAAAAESVAKSNSFAFKTYSNYNQGCEALAREFKKRGIERIGVLKAETEYGELCFSGVKKVYNTIVEQAYKQGEIVSAQMLSFKGKDIQAIINGSFEGDVVNMLRAARNLGYKVMVGAAEDTFTTKLRADFGDILEGSMSFGLQRLSDKMIEKARKIEGGDRLVGYEGVGLGYVHIKQIYSAVDACETRSINCLVDKLSKSAADNEVGFEGWKDRIAQLRTTVKQYKNGNFQNVENYLSGE